MIKERLEHLTIFVENQKLSFMGGDIIQAFFNPEKLSFAKSVSWQQERANQRDVPERQFTSANARTLSVDLLFDTYDNPSPFKPPVSVLTDRLLALTMVDADKHRPPICALSWGAWGLFFQGVLDRLTQDFTLFMENGTPVRAKCRCTFKEWRTNFDDQNKQGLQSSDVVKAHTVKRGDTLSSIAAKAYNDPFLWRHIAEANGIDNPLNLNPGAVLIIPTLKAGQAVKGRQA